MNTDTASPAVMSYFDDITRTAAVRRTKDAAESLVTANLRFVVWVACEYQDCGLPLEDLIAEGNVGLVKAARRYDPTRGTKFCSYAVYWIRQTIREALMDRAQAIRLPANQVDKIRKLNHIQQQAEQQAGRFLSVDEVSELAGVEPDDCLSLCVTSLDESAFENEPNGATFLDYLPGSGPLPDEIAEQNELSEDAWRRMDRLPAREKWVVSQYFGLGDDDPKTLEQIGNELGITRERVRQIRDGALERLQRRAERERRVAV